MSFIEFSAIFVIVLSISLAQRSPCPNNFYYQPAKTIEDTWFGVIKFKSPMDITDVTLEIQFDNKVRRLENSFGKAENNSDSTIFKVKNTKKTVKANTLYSININVKYKPYYDSIPRIKRILLNDREFCPRDDLRNLAITINTKNCGRKGILPNPLIVGGQNTTEGQWPWHAALYTLEGRRREYTCGGTLISENHILTAAHCTTVINKDGNPASRDPNRVQITLGKYGIYVFGKNEQNRNVSRIIVHPNYNRSNLHNDISMIILSNPVEFTEYVKPICLWEEGPDESTVVNRIGTAVGWGRDEDGNAITDLLKVANMPVIERLKCILAQGTYYSMFTTENTLCAGFANGTAVCNGDSGGGLVFPKKGTHGSDEVWQIRGIVSNTVTQTGSVCDPNYYVVFTDVAKYLNWINETMR